MKRLDVYISSQAKRDILDLEYTITNEYQAPKTASTYVKELYEAISRLSTYAPSIRVSDKKDVLRFGASARVVRFKKMAIVYTVHHNRVVVRAVLPASLIKK